MSSDCSRCYGVGEKGGCTECGKVKEADLRIKEAKPSIKRKRKLTHMGILKKRRR